jgi:hypothetical protein
MLGVFSCTQVWWYGQKRNQETCAPLTSLDWNQLEPTILGTTSIDTTCTIWDLNVRVALSYTFYDNSVDAWCCVV